MKEIYFKIKGMHCKSCENKIKNNIKIINNISSVTIFNDILSIKYKNDIDIDNIILKIKELGYYTDQSLISYDLNSFKNKIKISEFIIILLSILLFYFILDYFFDFNIFNIIPVIDNRYSIPYLFVVGLLTSIHCVSMCGAFNLIASSGIKPTFKNPVLYNLGRLTSYTLIGGFFGFIGSFISLNNTLNGIIIIIASIIMFIMSFNMLKILNINIFKLFPNIKIKNKGSFIIGLFNGIMPCGPLQAMQLYALSTSSLILGALSMFFFALGTIPLMLTIGLIINFLSFKRKNFINKISAVLILILSFVMLNRGLLSLGIDISKLTKEDYSSYLKSNIVDGIQYIDFDLTFMGYQDIVVQKGIPVVMTIKTNHRSLNGCNNEIKFAQLGFSKQLFEGDNKIEFTINKTGKYYYTCWMNMYKNSIIVIDNISFFSNNKGE